MSDWRARATPVPPAPAVSVAAENGQPDWKTRATPADTLPAKTGADTAFLRHGLSGLTGGYSDEMVAYLESKMPALAVPMGELLEGKRGPESLTYQEARAGQRALEDKAAVDQPEASLAGNIAGSVTQALSPLGRAIPAGKGLSGALKTGAGFGAFAGLGNSKADLTAGEVGRAAFDTVAGGVLGAGLGAVGHGLGVGLQGLRERAGRGIQDAIESQAARELALAEKAIASAKGSYGKSVSEAARDLEVMAREAAELPAGAAREALESFLSSPRALALREAVAGAKLETAPTRIADMAAKKAGLESLAAGKEANVAAQTGEALTNPWAKHIKPRVLTLGSRLLPPAIAGMGGILGGPEGAAAGAVVGGVMSLTQGAPGRIVKNLLESPAVRKATWEKVAGAASEGVQEVASATVRPLFWRTAHAVATRPEVFGPFAATLAKAMEGGEDELAATHARLSATSPDYQERTRRLAAEEENE